MQIRQFFVKPIDRNIEGVIKADDETQLRIEVEEYVITNEIAKNLGYFFDAYNNPAKSSMACWISGFFGSGKSHLLKMLAYLLANGEVAGISILDEFSKKLENDALLKAEMRKAALIPSESILFNIDQKAAIISKDDFNAVLGVFIKVFDDFCGYYGQQGYIAQFERDLDKQGLLEKFEGIFQDIAGISWHEGREAFNLNRSKISTAYAQLTGNPEASSEDVVMSYREDYKPVIEDFANNVADYIKTKEPGFRLNFFVDEVGQYIAENIKLMTNLQTIAESLATKCKGQAWLVVTSQDDMSSVLGELSTRPATDFSKIQARFTTQIHLSSADVAEVIQKRLLEKTDEGKHITKALYAAQSNNFGTLFSFPDGGTAYRAFRGEEEFVASYPFITYQYPLFQEAIESLSRHSAFTGKHNSVGERSMLGVFQEAAKTIGELEEGSIPSFDLMFEGIRDALKSRTKGAIQRAEDFFGEDHFAVKVLKALFLVKYIQGFNATPRNLRVLMQSHFEEDIAKLETDIIAALASLEDQTYIQRNGDVYEYLTNEEQDIENEIKEVTVDNDEIYKTLEDIFFLEIIRTNKIHDEETQQDYAFTKRIDEIALNRAQELVIDFITPFSSYSDNLVALKAHCLDKPEMYVVLPEDDTFVKDLYLFKRTEKYTMRNSGQQGSETVRMILGIKADMNRERKRNLSKQAAALISRATFIVSGKEVEIAGEDPRSRIFKAFSSLVNRIYPNLAMLNGKQYHENEIRSYLNISRGSLFTGENVQLNEAERDLLAFIKRNKRNGIRTTLKTIQTTYEKRPYGWPLAAIQCITAMLAGRGKIECRADGTLLEDGGLESELRNTHTFANLIIDPAIDIDPRITKQLQRFIGDFFDEPTTEGDPRQLMKKIQEKLREKVQFCNGYMLSKDRYPFLSALTPAISKMDTLAKQQFEYYIENLPGETEDWLDTKELTLDPISQFMAENSSKREIFDAVIAFISRNSADIDPTDLDELGEIREDKLIYSGNKLQQMKVKLEAVKEKQRKKLRDAKDDALQKIDNLKEQFHGMSDFQALDEEKQAELDRSFDEIVYTINQQSLAVSIHSKAAEYEAGDYNHLLNRMAQMAHPPQSPVTPGGTPVPAAPVIEYVLFSQLSKIGSKTILQDSADVEVYIEKLREKLLAAINENKRIRL